MSPDQNSTTDQAPGAGSTPPSGYQLVVFSGEATRTFDLPVGGKVTIGRDAENTVRIGDPSVSREHAVLRVGESPRKREGD